MSVAIVGAALSEIGTPKVEAPSALALTARAAHRALADAGLTLADVDGLFGCGFGETSTYDIADYLGLAELGYIDGTCVGGSTWVAFVEHALAALEAGLCRVALIAHGAMAYTDRRRHLPIWPDRRTPLNQFDLAVGGGFIPAHALAAQRYLADYGLGPEALAEVAVAARRWSAKNPLARFRDPVSVEEVRASRPIASPLNLLDCCLISDGGGAVVLMRSDEAADTRAPIRVAGVGSSQGHFSIAGMEDLTRTPAVHSGARAYRMAGLGPADIDHAMLYDSFTITPVLAMEDLGLAPRGGATHRFATDTGPGGALPVNTNGGGLAFAHTGMYGIFTLIECVTQLRGEAGERQVECEVSLAHAVGDFLSSAATCILTRP
ncbi:thiolase C-terminal domain-containing protein [Acuticoccus kandeliae]|uniref:thiolase C-terminal domain-containing protein n=1 Tax=Acuticoccus kandeliae TaxID=2073160 RepID=UPI0013006E6D|nr:thiolase [Acuticoccus kandeliae]